VMEYVAGGTLRSRLPLPPEDAERVVKQLCSALAYAHTGGIVHRDIKPENVLFDGEGRARLADFGIARLLLDEHTTLTAPLVVLGTPRYMAPEARAGASADPRSDVFAVGVLLQEMLGAGETFPLAVFEAQRLADGRLATRARFETWPMLWAAAAWAVALVAYGLLRGQWRRAGLDSPTPEQPVAAVRPVFKMALILNALFVVHLVLERTALRPLVIYIPVLGGMLELAMVYLVWVAILEALRTSRLLLREPWLWLGALISLFPPVISFARLLRGGQP